MELLGDRSWYMPPFLRWLPDLRVEIHSVTGHPPPTVSGE
jgi:hypothetical protein